MTAMSERKPGIPSAHARAAARQAATPGAPVSASEVGPRRATTKFGAATDGWDAYNDWLDRARQPAPPSRQAVISKSLYSIASYKSWADKARGAFDKAK